MDDLTVTLGRAGALAWAVDTHASNAITTATLAPIILVLFMTSSTVATAAEGS